jgi:hypothetical protein
MVRMKKLFYSSAVLIFSAVIWAEQALAQACPMCKESAANQGEKLAEGFQASIYAMVFLPAVLVSTVSVFVIKASYMKKHPDSKLGTFGIIREYIKERKS